MRADFLLDTSFVSALFPGAGPLPDRLEAWVIESQHRFYVPTIAIAEVASGVSKLKRADAHRRAASYEVWLAQIVELFADRILPLDLTSAQRTGELLDYAVSIGHHPGFADIAIAAIADAHGLAVLTRNVDDFTPLRVACADPFKALPR